LATHASFFFRLASSLALGARCFEPFVHQVPSARADAGAAMRVKLSSWHGDGRVTF
jgi:hypothetical protein